MAGDLGDERQRTDAPPNGMAAENNEQQNLGNRSTPKENISEVIGMVFTSGQESAQLDFGKKPWPMGKEQGSNQEQPAQQQKPIHEPNS